jgi:hypothetical protein
MLDLAVVVASRLVLVGLGLGILPLDAPRESEPALRNCRTLSIEIHLDLLTVRFHDGRACSTQ